MEGHYLQFIPDLSQEGFAAFDVLFGLDAFGGKAVDDPQDPPSLFGFGDDYFHGIGCCTKDVAYFEDMFDGIENVYGEDVSHENDETVTGGQVVGVLFGQFNQGIIGTGVSHETLHGRLTEGNTEFCHGNGIDHRLMDVFDGFDKMGLSQDQIQFIRIFDFHCL